MSPSGRRRSEREDVELLTGWRQSDRVSDPAGLRQTSRWRGRASTDGSAVERSRASLKRCSRTEDMSAGRPFTRGDVGVSTVLSRRHSLATSAFHRCTSLPMA